MIKKKVLSHLKKDIKTFKHEAKEDKELIKEIKHKKHEKKESKNHEKKEKEHKEKKHEPKKKKGKVAIDIKLMKEGRLHSGSKKGPLVTSPKQAIAIGLSQERKLGHKIPKALKKKK